MSFASNDTVIIDGQEFKVYTNGSCIPDVLIIGSIGAIDQCLYPVDKKNIDKFIEIKGYEPQVIETSGHRFIKNTPKGGGAAHFFIEQLPFYAPQEYKIGLFSIMGRNDYFEETLTQLEALNIQYYILYSPEMLPAEWSGIAFGTGKRYWSQVITNQEPMFLYRPELLPPFFLDCPLSIVTSLPLANTYSFSRVCGGTLVGQIFENYLVKDYYTMLDELIYKIWQEKCSILNINETELLILGDYLYKNGNNNNSSRKIKQNMKLLTEELNQAIFLLGLGKFGMCVGYGNNANHRQYYLPSIPSEWSFGLGAGDTALASAVGKILEIIRNKGGSLRNFADCYTTFLEEDWLAIARAFIEGGYVGISIIDALTPVDIRKRLIEEAKSKSSQINFQSLDSLYENDCFRSSLTKDHNETKLAPEVMEALLFDAYGGAR